MNKILSFAAIALSLFIAAGCDEGRIYDDVDLIPEQKEGLSAEVSAKVKNTSTWTEGYTLSLAGFEDGNEYALISKGVESDATGNVAGALNGIPTNAGTLELCVIDRLRRRITTLLSVVPSGEHNEIIGGEEEIDGSMYGAIQREILNTTCIQCHGGSNFSAAGLSLLEGESLRATIGISSHVEEGELRIKAGSSSESLLYRILSGNESAGWKYDHSVEITAPEKLELIRKWIDGGCPI